MKPWPPHKRSKKFAYSTEDISYLLGLDLGQSRDYTAISIVEEQVWDGALGEWVSPEGMPPEILDRLHRNNWSGYRPPNPPLHIRYLSRFPLGTPYPDIVARVKRMVNALPIADKPGSLIVDKTGVGAAVLDAFVYAGINPLAVTIHGGSTLTADTHGAYVNFRVPKRDLVTTMQVLMQNRRLLMPASLPEGETLRKELLNFRLKIDPKTAHDSYEHWREGDHDDLVLATAMACWFREWRNKKVETYYADKARRVC